MAYKCEDSTAYFWLDIRLPVDTSLKERLSSPYHMCPSKGRGDFITWQDCRNPPRHIRCWNRLARHWALSLSIPRRVVDKEQYEHGSEGVASHGPPYDHRPVLVLYDLGYLMSKPLRQTKC